MEPEWMKWCRENMPKRLFDEMKNSRRHDAAWRDERIRRLVEDNKRLKAQAGEEGGIFSRIYWGRVRAARAGSV